MAIQWHESLSIGIAGIDNQHKELISRFDRFLKACETDKGGVELNNSLDFLKDYSIKHFRDEEKLQLDHKYPGYETHRKEHESFIVNLEKIRSEIDREGATLHHIIAINNMLIKWLVDHISASDGAIGTFLKTINP